MTLPQSCVAPRLGVALTIGAKKKHIIKILWCEAVERFKSWGYPSWGSLQWFVLKLLWLLVYSPTDAGETTKCRFNESLKTCKLLGQISIRLHYNKFIFTISFWNGLGLERLPQDPLERALVHWDLSIHRKRLGCEGQFISISMSRNRENRKLARK